MVRVRDIMKNRVITVDPEVNISDAAKIMTNNRVGSLVVLKNDKAVGIVTDADIVGVVARGGNLKEIKIRDLPKTKRRFVTASPDETIMSVTKKMIKNGIKRIPVIKDDKLQGIISDKEILLTSPELINVLSEKLKMRVDLVSQPDQEISGICEECEGYSDNLRNIGGRWLCENCRS